MQSPPKMSEMNFLSDRHYDLYVKGKTKQTWDDSCPLPLK